MIVDCQLDCKQGGWIEYTGIKSAFGQNQDGKTEDAKTRIEFPPCPEREVLEVWGNGAVIELFYYPTLLPNENASDCMRVVITEAGRKPRGWLLNIEDANSLIHALSTGIRLAIDDRRAVAPVVE